MDSVGCVDLCHRDRMLCSSTTITGNSREEWWCTSRVLANVLPGSSFVVDAEDGAALLESSSRSRDGSDWTERCHEMLRSLVKVYIQEKAESVIIIYYKINMHSPTCSWLVANKT